MLERAYRKYVPVDSFTKVKPQIVEEVYKPDVGVRWGKPSDFVIEGEFETGQQKSMVRISRLGDLLDDDDEPFDPDEPVVDDEFDPDEKILLPEDADEIIDETDDPNEKLWRFSGRSIFINNIEEATEIWRYFRIGPVIVRIDEPDIVDGWEAQYKSLQSVEETGYTVMLEEIVEWLAPANLIFEETSNRGEIVSTVEIFYKYSFQPYIPFSVFPHNYGERGKHPAGGRQSFAQQGSVAKFDASWND